MSGTEATPNTSNWSEEEKKAFEKYGRLPKQSQILGKKDKKYFDSADWASGANTGSNAPKPK